MSIKTDDLKRLCKALSDESTILVPPLDNDLAVDMMERAAREFDALIECGPDDGNGNWSANSIDGFWVRVARTFPEAVAAALLAALDAGAFENGGDR